MGLYNSLFVECECPVCNSKLEREIQFKFGECRLHRYRKGDSLLESKQLKPPSSKIIIDGVTDCQVCNTLALKCEIEIQNNVIRAARIELSVLSGPNRKRPKINKKSKKQKKTSQSRVSK